MAHTMIRRAAAHARVHELATRTSDYGVGAKPACHPVTHGAGVKRRVPPPGGGRPDMYGVGVGGPPGVPPLPLSSRLSCSNARIHRSISSRSTALEGERTPTPAPGRVNAGVGVPLATRADQRHRGQVSRDAARSLASVSAPCADRLHVGATATAAPAHPALNTGARPSVQLVGYRHGALTMTISMATPVRTTASARWKAHRRDARLCR